MEVEKRFRVMVGRDPGVQIDEKRMEECPLCGGKKFKGPQHKRATEFTPDCLAYECVKCNYTQYVHTADSKFLKSMGIKPT